MTTGRPIRGVRLVLNGTSVVVSGRGGSAAGSLTPTPRTVNQNLISDNQGRFSFTGLPAGRFLLEAVHDQFLPASYGQPQPGKRGRPIELGDAQQVDLQFPMTRGSAITGIVTDEHGDPLVQARVRALRYLVNQNGVTRLRVVNEVTTDDRGTYRFFNLAPGDYRVSATALSAEMMEQVRFEMGFTADADVSGNPAPAILSIQAREGSPLQGVPVFAPTYHPVSPSAANALGISVDGIVERTGVDIQVLPVRTGRIRGTVAGRLDPSVPVQVLLHNTDAAEEPTSLVATVARDGTFTLGDVAPGQYTVYAQTLPAPASTRSNFQNVQSVRTASFDRLHGRTAITVTGPDTPPVSIALLPGRSISGRVVLDVTRPRGSGERSETTISITPAPRPAGLPAFNTSPRVQVAADGTFTLPGIRPGRYFLRAAGPAPVRSVVLNGADTLDFPLEVTSDQDVSGVVVTLSDRLSELSGTITDGAGNPADDCTVVIVAADRRFWVHGTRRVASARPATDGRYRFVGLPAGEYRVAAVTDLEPGSLYDAKFLEQLAGASLPVAITAGGSQYQDMRLAR